MDELWHLVRLIPRGKCCTYGDLGRALSHPTIGHVVGRWMATCPPDIPWWRVVAKSGAIPLSKSDALAGLQQRERLLGEGVPFVGDLVDLEACLWTP